MPRRVLVTNDDGITAPGIRHLAAAALAAGFDVTVAAPLEESSGISAAMTAVVTNGRVVTGPRELKSLDGTRRDGVRSVGVGASPGYIVTLATLGAFGPAPDLVLTGINRGANAGNAVLHSGTVGAALTAAGAGLPAMAVSLDVLSPVAATVSSAGAAIENLDEADDEARNWPAAAELAGQMLGQLVDLPRGTVVNLNVPDAPLDQLRGVRRAALARFGQVTMAIAEATERYVRTRIQESEHEPDPDTDLALLAEGWATVTPIRTITAVDVDLELPAPPA